LGNSIGIGIGQCFCDLFVGREEKRRACEAVSALSLVLATQTKKPRKECSFGKHKGKW